MPRFAANLTMLFGEMPFIDRFAAARVAGRYCVLHTVPVFDGHQTTYLRKFAYGAPVVEVIFGRNELMSLCRDAGLRLQRQWPCIPYDVSEVTDHRSTTETYLFTKAR